MEIIPDQSTDLYGPSSTEDIAEITKPVATMELQIGQAVLRMDDIYIVCGYTDMRKQIDGLYSIVKDQFHMDPEQRALYLFCGRRCDRIKALLYENDGFVLLYKRLTASEGRYRWPRNKNEVQPITWRQFDWLMSGLEIEQPKAIRPRKPENEKE